MWFPAVGFTLHYVFLFIILWLYYLQGDDDENNLIDGNPETFWESDGTNGEHWIRLKMKRGTIINRCLIFLHDIFTLMAKLLG